MTTDTDVRLTAGHAAPVLTPTDIAPAIENLTNCQRQLDMDGCEVGVSRQALDEVLGHLRTLTSAPSSGWKVVPREPTPQMIDARIGQMKLSHVADWQAMYDAAPPASPQGEST